MWRALIFFMHRRQEYTSRTRKLMKSTVDHAGTSKAVGFDLFMRAHGSFLGGNCYSQHRIWDARDGLLLMHTQVCTNSCAHTYGSGNCALRTCSHMFVCCIHYVYMTKNMQRYAQSHELERTTREFVPFHC
jgi:hypothetical protein